MSLYKNLLLIVMAPLFFVCCSTDGTLEDEKRLDLRQPMVFGLSSSAAEQTVTRAVALEGTHQSFKVSTWKGFGLATQQVVMDGYEVDYTPTMQTDYGDGYHWLYEDITPEGKTNKQILRYWDLAAFPYEFRAVSPYSGSTTITTSEVTIDASDSPFQSEKHINYGKHIAAYNTSTPAEPFIVAHVKREKSGTDYVDTDVIKNVEINSTGKANATREVHMPFHHLMSKIGFRIFIDNPQPTHSDYEVHIKDITISVVDAKDKFVIASNKYTATNNDQGLGKGTFDHIYASASNTTTASATYKYNGEYILLEHDEPYPYKETIDGVEKNLDFHNHLNKEAAFDLTPGELLQIPQKEVKLRVQIHIQTYHVTGGEKWVDFTFDSILRTETLNDTDITPTPGDTFTWEPEKKYIYYLRIKNLHGHEIVLHTCEVLPWDDVQTADIEIGL